MAGFFQEKNGDNSSRRLYGFLYLLVSIPLFTIGALKESKWAFWGGVACTAASIVYPILTTAQDLREISKITAMIRGGTYAQEGPDSPDPGEK